MLSIATQTSLLPQTKYFGPAQVLKFSEPDRSVLLQINYHFDDELEVWAKSALPVNHEFLYGETVLAAGEDIDHLYVIGLLDYLPAKKSNSPKITLKNGVSAEVSDFSGYEKLQVCSEKGELIFEYNAKSGKCCVNIQSGDLEFVTVNGNIDFVSEKDIRFFCKQSVELQSNQEIRLQTTNAIGNKLSTISLKHNKLKLNSTDVDISAQRSKIHIAESKYIGKQFQGRIKNVKLELGRLESIANTVVEKAENIYKSVKGLTQLKTGRMRTLVESTVHFKGKKVFMKAEEDFKVKAEKIHLG